MITEEPVDPGREGDVEQLCEEVDELQDDVEDLRELVEKQQGVIDSVSAAIGCEPDSYADDIGEDLLPLLARIWRLEQGLKTDTGQTDDGSEVDPEDIHEDALTIQKFVAMLRNGHAEWLDKRDRRAVMIYGDFFDVADPSMGTLTLSYQQACGILEDHGVPEQHRNSVQVGRAFDAVEEHSDGLVSHERTSAGHGCSSPTRTTSPHSKSSSRLTEGGSDDLDPPLANNVVSRVRRGGVSTG